VRGKPVYLETPVSDPATVLAIFPGDPFLVVTDKGVAGVRSEWENPFMAGMPSSVARFAPEP
jgi:hypothetical protein